MKILEMWISGIKIIMMSLLGVIGMAIMMVIVTVLLYLSFDLLVEALFGEGIWPELLFQCKTYEEVWQKIKSHFFNK